jgi:hypothetical protein
MRNEQGKSIKPRLPDTTRVKTTPNKPSQAPITRKAEAAASQGRKDALKYVRKTMRTGRA